MPAKPLQYSSAFAASVDGIRKLHELTTVGRLDSPEADAIRDALDAPWGALTQQEKDRLSGLSEDLYSITDPPQTSVKQSNPQFEAKKAEIIAAQSTGESDRALEMLRRWKDYFDPSLVSWFRGAIWLEADAPSIATLFYKHASELDPGNSHYLTLFLSALLQADPPAAAQRAEELLNSSDELSPQVAALAVNALFGRARELPGEQAERFFGRLIPVLDQAKAKIESANKLQVAESTHSLVCILLGFCHEFLRQNQAALESYSQGLDASPNNDSLLVARGIFKYGEDPTAIQDFSRAIRLGTTLILPYVFLAHNYMINGQFEECRRTCEQGLTKAGSDSFKSELREWLAISQSGLNFPFDVVRKSFDLAIALDPSNERARRNLAAFDAAMRPIPATAFETRSSWDIRESTLADRRQRRAA